MLTARRGYPTGGYGAAAARGVSPRWAIRRAVRPGRDAALEVDRFTTLSVEELGDPS